eukprot:SAG31_NODE_189_length_20842_cov_12.518151_14_plen_59_part_00
MCGLVPSHVVTCRVLVYDIYILDLNLVVPVVMLFCFFKKYIYIREYEVPLVTAVYSQL